ncbi:MAG: helix-turn-helix transcriptional regulator [Ruminococcus sp.]|nr:helix-turn-helix transcriptional regulator [Ruminococcus sp.]
MYNNQEIASKIKQTAKSKNISIKQLLESCNLNVNYISQFANGRDMTVGNLYAIANQLDVSIDYLLSRTNEPTGTVNNSYNQSGNNNFQTVGSLTELSKRDAELLQKVNSLDFSDYADIINYINEKLKNNNK